MPQGGCLTLTCQQITPPAKNQPGRVEVSVADTGCGIEPGNLKKIKEPLFSTKTRGLGLGLGLALAQAIVERHNGELTVSSEPGSGATFTIALNIAEESA